MRSRFPLAISVLALLVAIGGGPALSEAARIVSKNTVTSSSIRNGSIKSADLARNAVTSSRIRTGAVTSSDLKDGGVASVDLVDGGVSGADIASGAVSGAKLADDAVTAGKIANGAVTSARLADDAVTSGKIATGAVTTSKYAGGPTARVSKSSNQTIPNLTFTPIAFDTEHFDVGAMHRTDADSTRLTTTTAGVYSLTANVTWLPGADNTGREVNLRKNGVTVLARVVQQADTLNTTDQSIATIASFAAGDYVELVVRQNAGADRVVSAGTEFTPVLAAAWVAPAP